MNNVSILKQVLAIGALFFIVTSCDKSELAVDASAQQLQSEIDHSARLDAEVSVTSYEVAKIQKDGNDYIFEAVGEEDDMVMLVKVNELAEENDEVFRIAESYTPFEAFIALTNDNVKVPLRIAKTVDESVVKASNREISESTSLLEILDTNSSTEASSRGCYDVGYTNFRNKYCYGINSGSNYYDVRFCDNGLRTQLYRDPIYKGDRKRLKKVRTWTNIRCGTVKIKFYTNKYPLHGTWEQKLYYQKDLPNGLWWVNKFSNTADYRTVFRYNRSGTFRAYTRFSN